MKNSEHCQYSEDRNRLYSAQTQINTNNDNSLQDQQNYTCMLRAMKAQLLRDYRSKYGGINSQQNQNSQQQQNKNQEYFQRSHKQQSQIVNRQKRESLWTIKSSTKVNVPGSESVNISLNAQDKLSQIRKRQSEIILKLNQQQELSYIDQCTNNDNTSISRQQIDVQSTNSASTQSGYFIRKNKVKSQPRTSISVKNMQFMLLQSNKGIKNPQNDQQNNDNIVLMPSSKFHPQLLSRRQSQGNHQNAQINLRPSTAKAQMTNLNKIQGGPQIKTSKPEEKSIVNQSFENIKQVKANKIKPSYSILNFGHPQSIKSHQNFIDFQQFTNKNQSQYSISMLKDQYLGTFMQIPQKQSQLNDVISSVNTTVCLRNNDQHTSFSRINEIMRPVPLQCIRKSFNLKKDSSTQMTQNYQEQTQVPKAQLSNYSQVNSVKENMNNILQNYQNQINQQETNKEQNYNRSSLCANKTHISVIQSTKNYNKNYIKQSGNQNNTTLTVHQSHHKIRKNSSQHRNTDQQMKIRNTMNKIGDIFSDISTKSNNKLNI
eukprot:403345016